MRPSSHRIGKLLCSLCVGLLVAIEALAEQVVVTVASPDPTAEIDHFIGEAWTEQNVQPAERCSDRQFVRRVYLDVVGRIPTVAEAATFLHDGRENKREHLIDVLLASEDYAQHFADVLDALLMGRSEEAKYDQRRQHHWRSYLEGFVRENRPWDTVASEILLARPDDPSARGAVWFLYERNNDHQAIAEAVAPAFFGLRIECAQCHDHMMADEIKQRDYWGLVAFFNRGKNEDTKLGPRIAESAVGGFSEFADLMGDSHPNRLTFLGSPPVPEQRPGEGQEQEETDEMYVSVDSGDAPRVPKFSRRAAFVENVLEDHPRLARAMVNRVWAMLMGRGIVHPFDEMDSMHPPSHPELLKVLADDFAASDYDLRRLVRCIARSRAYQLSSVRPTGVEDPASFAWYLERPLTAEQMARSVQLAVRGRFTNDAELVRGFRQQFRDVMPDTFVGTVADALYLSNHPQLDRFLSDSNAVDDLRARILRLDSPRDRTELLFQTIFHRSPDDDEHEAVQTYIDPRESNPADAIDQVIWSMLTSAEFRLNH